MGLGIEVEARVVSEEAEVVKEMVGVISTKTSRGQNGGSGNDQQDQPRGANGDQGQANRARTPFCFYCKKQKADKTDHWPSQCQLLGNILSDWHAGESQSGHQDHQGNSSGQH